MGALDTVKVDVNKIQGELESIACVVNKFTEDKCVSNLNDTQIVALLRDENVLSDALEVLTVELAKRSPIANLDKSIVEVVTPYANSSLPPTIGIAQLHNQMEDEISANVAESRPTHKASELGIALASPKRNTFVPSMSNAQNSYPFFEEQLQQYKQAHKNQVQTRECMQKRKQIPLKESIKMKEKNFTALS